MIGGPKTFWEGGPKGWGPKNIPDNCHFFYTDTIFGAEILHPNARI